MIGKTRKSENHINRLLPRLRCLIGNWKYWSWPEELKSLTRHLGGLRGYIGTKCHRRTDNNGAQLLFVLWYDLMQELSDGWWILRGWTSFFNALVRTFVPRWKNWSWERISGYDRNLIFITHDFSYGSPLWFGWLCTNRDRIFLGGFPHIWLQFLGKGWCGLFHTRFQNISSSNKGDHGRAGLQDLHLLLLLAGGHLLLPPPPDGGDVAGVPLHRRRRRARLVVEGSHYSWRRRPRDNWSKSRNEN